VSTIVLPQQNRRDLEEVPKELLKEVEFVFVESVRQVLKVALA
jgi:ATP-dependent Lon protease